MSQKERYDQYHKVTTPKLEIIHPHVDQPDERFASNDGTGSKYKVTMILDPENEQHAELLKVIPVWVDQHYNFECNQWIKEGGKGKAKADKAIPHSPLKAELDRETGEETGRFLVECKSSNQPIVFDSRNNRVDPVPRIGYNSIVRLNVTFVPFTFPGAQPLAGSTVYLNKIQIIDLKSPDASPFDEDEGGYEWTPPPQTPTQQEKQPAAAEVRNDYSFEPDDELPF